MRKTNHQPPILAQWLLGASIRKEDRCHRLGDFEEVYQYTLEQEGCVKAWKWYWFQVIRSIPEMVKNSTCWGGAMFKNYLIIALRNLKSSKAYTFINIAGLGIGICATVLILLHLRFELSYDRFHEQADDIYRVSVVVMKEGKWLDESPVFTAPLGEEMKLEFPEVENSVRISEHRKTVFHTSEKSYKMNQVRHADPAFFNVFSFQLEAGDPTSVLRDPFSIVLTRSEAERIFPDGNPVGKTLTDGARNPYTVRGIVADPPANSDIQFNALISFSTLYRLPGMYMDWAGGNQYIAYLKLKSNTPAAELEAKFPDFMWRKINQKSAEVGWKFEPYLQPLKRIYLFHNEDSKIKRTNIYVFSIIAFFVLIIACINFINLTTARATRRAKEVGLRKVIGADRGSLIRQFLGESVMLSFAGLIIAVVLVKLLAPTFQQLLGDHINLRLLASIWTVLGLVLVGLIVGILAGSFPAFYLSSFQSVKVIKGVFVSGKSKEMFRNALVVFQFSISLVLIISTLVINNQLKYMQRLELGYDRENVLVIPLESSEIREKSDLLKSELLNLPEVLNVSQSSGIPVNGLSSNGYIPEGFQNPILINVVEVDENFLETFDMDVVLGRKFSNNFATDDNAYIINETLARQLNWADPIGKTINRNGDHPVIGVVADFNFESLHNVVEPCIISFKRGSERFFYLSLKIKSTDLPATMASIRGLWKGFAPSLTFDYYFLDDTFDTIYKKEKNFQQIAFYFSGLAICIALLGLFSLASYAMEQRSKEIGIRKVLGASIGNILFIFSRQFTLLILIANALAWPLSYYLMEKWLVNFAYRDSIGVGVFIIALLGSLLVALITIAYQAIRSALANPVNELQYE